MDKKQILKIIQNCAIKYKENLSNKNILFIYQEDNKIKYIETKFLPSNFLHLTGLKYNRIKNNTPYNFFKDVLDKKVSLDSLIIPNEILVKLKLHILSVVLSINYSAKMIGKFEKLSKNLLATDKLVGNQQYCIGFIKSGNYYIPNTSLKEDIRNITIKTNRIIAILDKDIKENQYLNLTYLNRKINPIKIIKNKKILLKIDFKNLYSQNMSYNKEINTIKKTIKNT